MFGKCIYRIMEVELPASPFRKLCETNQTDIAGHREVSLPLLSLSYEFNVYFARLNWIGLIQFGATQGQDHGGRNSKNNFTISFLLKIAIKCFDFLSF